LNRPVQADYRKTSRSTFVLYAGRSSCQKNPLRMTMPNTKKGIYSRPLRRHKRILVNFLATTEGDRDRGKRGHHISCRIGRITVDTMVKAPYYRVAGTEKSMIGP